MKTVQLENQSDVGFCDFPRTDSIETNFRTRGFLQNALSQNEWLIENEWGHNGLISFLKEYSYFYTPVFSRDIFFN